MRKRVLDQRRSLIVGAILSVVFTVNAVVSSTPGTRITAGLLVSGTCAVMAMLCFLTVEALRARQRRE